MVKWPSASLFWYKPYSHLVDDCSQSKQNRAAGFPTALRHAFDIF